MGLATHLGPWLLGTVKNTNGTATSQIRDMGATVVTQSYVVDRSAGATGTICTIPAGSGIIDMRFITTTAFSVSTSITLNFLGSPANQAVPITNTTISSVSTGASPTANVNLTNTGTKDATITYSLSGSATIGICTVIVRYVVRNADGSTAPTSAAA